MSNNIFGFSIYSNVNKLAFESYISLNNLKNYFTFLKNNICKKKKKNNIEKKSKTQKINI